MFVLPGYKIRHDDVLMWKITACFHAVNTETVSMVWTCRFARKWTGLCMGVLLNGHLPGVFLALKKHLSSSLEPSQPSYLAGISLELHLVAAWPYISHTELVLIGDVRFVKRTRRYHNTNYWRRDFCIKQTSGSKRTSFDPDS